MEVNFFSVTLGLGEKKRSHRIHFEYKQQFSGEDWIPGRLLGWARKLRLPRLGGCIYQLTEQGDATGKYQGNYFLHFKVETLWGKINSRRRVLHCFFILLSGKRAAGCFFLSALIILTFSFTTRKMEPAWLHARAVGRLQRRRQNLNRKVTFFLGSNRSIFIKTTPVVIDFRWQLITTIYVSRRRYFHNLISIWKFRSSR